MNRHDHARNPHRPLSPAEPHLDHYVVPGALNDLIHLAKREDLGPNTVDLTTRLMIPEDQAGQAVARSRKAGRLAGAAILPAIAAAYSPTLTVKSTTTDGQHLAANTPIATITGPLHGILAMERVALNFMIHLSGIATLTAQYVGAITHTKARVFDTRKTLPGLRALEKYAVACGGGHNHRFGLYDAVLVKDNHLAHLTSDQFQAFLLELAKKARATTPPPRFIELEVDTLEQFHHAIQYAPTCIDLVLLDNFTLEQTRQAVAMRDSLAPSILLEASGGISLDDVVRIAETGVDRIAVGALTHSAPALDIGMDITS